MGLKNLTRIALCSGLALAVTTSVAMAETIAKPGGGDLNPGLYTYPESIKKFEDMKVGLSVHWGPSALGGKEISWSRNKEIPTATYDSFYKSFNPVKFDAKNWVQLMKDGGMKYIILTSKHHDGFSLWPSKYTEYDMDNTPSRRDIVKELSVAIKKANIVFGSYYSIIDWYHPDYTPNEHGGPGPLFKPEPGTPDFDRYVRFMKGQLRELVVDYGAEIIQFDGEWDKTWNHERGSDLYKYVRTLNPKTLVSSRVDVGRYHLDPKTKQWDFGKYAGDFDERERMVDWIVGEESRVFGKSNNPWQAWVTIDQAQWAWNATPRLLKTDEIIIDLVKTVGDGGNYLINLGPRADGSFEPEQAEMIRTVGRWLKQNGDGIYGTKAGPYSKEGAYTSTLKGKAITLFVLDPKLTEVTLAPWPTKLGRAKDSVGKSLITRRTTAGTTIELPQTASGPVRIIKFK